MIPLNEIIGYIESLYIGTLAMGWCFDLEAFCMCAILCLFSFLIKILCVSISLGWLKNKIGTISHFRYSILDEKELILLTLYLCA
jgi:hypothetical protein